MIRWLPLLLSAGCAAPEPVLVGWQWSEQASLPEVRWGMPAVLAGSEQLAFGGADSVATGRTTDQRWRRDPLGDAWTTTLPEEGPAPRYCHCSLWLPSVAKLLVVGGRDDNAPVEDAWVYDPASEAWTIVPGEVPDAPIGCHAAWVADQAWIFGGGTSTGVSDGMWTYDPDANAFAAVELSETPSARRDATTVVADGRWLLFGGQTGPGSFVNDVWAYDGAAWSELSADAPLLPRRYAASAWHPEHGAWLVHGGTDDTQDMSDSWMMDTTTLEWAELDLEGGPAQRAFATSGFDGIGMYVAGGMRVASSTPLDDAWRLVPVLADDR